MSRDPEVWQKFTPELTGEQAALFQCEECDCPLHECPRGGDHGPWKFEDCPPDVKTKAVEKWTNNYAGDDEWWEFTYEDANRAAFTITSFDLDGKHTITLEMPDPRETAEKIMEEHGTECDTYKTAERFIEDRNDLIENADKDENGDLEDEDELTELEDQFKKDIGEDYLKMLQADYDYQTSDEAAAESLDANDYDINEEGEIC